MLPNKNPFPGSIPHCLATRHPDQLYSWRILISQVYKHVKIAMEKPVLRGRKYYFRLRLRGAANKNSVSDSYKNIYAAFRFLFLLTDSFITYLENYLLCLEYFLMWIYATMSFFLYKFFQVFDNI